MDKLKLFTDICTLVHTRCPSVFQGADMPLTSAFNRSCTGTAFPGFWLEMPLSGPMHTDLFLQYAKANLQENHTLPGDGFGYQPLFDWFAAQGNEKAGIALSVDIQQDGSASAAAVLNIQHGGAEDQDAFFEACGIPEAIPLLRQTMNDLPGDFLPWYVTAVWNRPERFCRASCYVSKECSARYAREPSLLDRQLKSLGCAFETERLCAFASALSAHGVRFEIQVDRCLDGSMRDTLNLSICMPPMPKAIRRWFAEEDGKAVVRTLKAWGMADERAEQLSSLAFSCVIPAGTGTDSPARIGVLCKPGGVKTVWKRGEPQAAKVYVECLTF